jgi:hypothetical protein
MSQILYTFRCQRGQHDEVTLALLGMGVALMAITFAQGAYVPRRPNGSGSYWNGGGVVVRAMLPKGISRNAVDRRMIELGISGANPRPLESTSSDQDPLKSAEEAA